jgi:hypothetical protein
MTLASRDVAVYRDTQHTNTNGLAAPNMSPVTIHPMLLASSSFALQVAVIIQHLTPAPMSDPPYAVPTRTSPRRITLPHLTRYLRQRRRFAEVKGPREGKGGGGAAKRVPTDVRYLQTLSSTSFPT